MPKAIIKMKRKKDCKGSVRFDSESPTADKALNSVYVNRSMPGINEAQSITVTIETP